MMMGESNGGDNNPVSLRDLQKKIDRANPPEMSVAAETEDENTQIDQSLDVDSLVDEMPDELKEAILEDEERKAADKEKREKEKEERVEPILDTWVFTEEREKREIVPLTLELPDPAK